MRSPRVKRRPGNPGRLNSPARRLDKPVRDQALELCRRLWREPVWDLKIVAARILARKPVEPDARVRGFVTERMAELDGWAVADNLASVASRCLLTDPGRLDAVEAWIENSPAGSDPTANTSRPHGAFDRVAAVGRFPPSPRPEGPDGLRKAGLDRCRFALTLVLTLVQSDSGRGRGHTPSGATRHPPGQSQGQSPGAGEGGLAAIRDV